jgi:hypothetical protein
MSSDELGTRCGHCAESRGAIAAHCPPLGRRYRQSVKAIGVGIDVYDCVVICPSTPEHRRAGQHRSRPRRHRHGERPQGAVNAHLRLCPCRSDRHMSLFAGVLPGRLAANFSRSHPHQHCARWRALKCQGSHRINNNGCQNYCPREPSALPQSLSHQLNAAYESFEYPPQTELAARRWRERRMLGGLQITPRISALSFRITHAGIALD